MKKYIFSVIIPVYNVENYLDEAVESVIKQSVGFGTIQLILINDGSTDNSADICLKYAEYPNVEFIDKENEGVSATRNLGISLARGVYTVFLDGDDKFSLNLLEICRKYLEKNAEKIDFVQVNTEFFDAKKGKHILSDGKKTQIIKLTGNVIVPMRVVFFKTSVLKKYKFDTTLAISEDFKLMCEIALEKNGFGYCADTTYWYRRRPEGGSAINNQRSIIGTFRRVTAVYKYLFDCDLEKFGFVNKFTESIVAYDLQWFKGDYPEELKETLEYAEAWDSFLYCLKFIEIETIKKLKNLSLAHMIGWINLKKTPCHLDEIPTPPRFYYEDIWFSNLGSSTVWVEIIGEKSAKFYIRGFFYVPLPENVKLIGKYNDHYFTAETFLSENYKRQSHYMGKIVNSAMMFNIEIPLETEDFIEFFFETPKNRRIPVIMGQTFSSRLNGDSEKAFFIGENFIISKTDLKNTLQVRKKNYANIVSELFDVSADFKWLISPDLYNYSEEILIFLKNFESFKNRKIWIFSDRVYENDDNGYVLYNYSKKIDDGIEKYYIISKNSQNLHKLKDDPNVLYWENIPDRVMLFFCEKFISSQTIREFVKINNSFPLFNVFFAAREFFLQHGIIKDDISLAYNGFNRDFSMFLTSAEAEYNSVLQKKYAFDPKIVKCLGLPRFDKLFSNPEKIIVFAPTWRKYKGFIIEGKYNESFKESLFFEKLQNFFNSKKMLQLLSKTGYKLLWKLHPLLIPQLEDFTIADNNLIITDINTQSYSELFQKASLFITDYSSTMFDFAYLKKPCIYWQEVPNHSPADYFDYEKMGFGEVVYSAPKLISTIKKYLENDCKMPQKYQKRVENFFKYTDKNNCYRVYNELIQE